jgi:hypothetical protein
MYWVEDRHALCLLANVLYWHVGRLAYTASRITGRQRLTIITILYLFIVAIIILFYYYYFFFFFFFFLKSITTSLSEPRDRSKECKGVPAGFTGMLKEGLW